MLEGKSSLISIMTWCLFGAKPLYKPLLSCCYDPCAWGVIKWKHFPRYCPFVRGIHRSLMNSPHKGQWRGALMLSLICVWIKVWENNREAGDLRRYRAHYDASVMCASLGQSLRDPIRPLLKMIVKSRKMSIFSDDGDDIKTSLLPYFRL